MITLKTFVFNAFQENTYLLYDESNSCIIVDAGMNSDADNKELIAFIEDNNLKPEAMVNTHCHIDHVLGCKFIKEHYNVPFYIHESELEILKRAPELGAVFGLSAEMPPEPDHFLNVDEAFQFGKSSVKFFFVPGHSEGSIAIYNNEAEFVITGDALFAGSIGRTDLPGGDYNTLITSIRTQLLTLPEKTRVFPGHGPSSTIGNEKNNNPFLN